MNESSSRAGVRELCALGVWLVLLLAPWCVHLLAVTNRAVSAEHFWLAAPMSLFALGLWRWMYGPPARNRHGELGLEANATVALWGSAAWLNIQTITALALFVYHGEGTASRWAFALWVLAGSALVVAMLWRRVRTVPSS